MTKMYAIGLVLVQVSHQNSIPLIAENEMQNITNRTSFVLLDKDEDDV